MSSAGGKKGQLGENEVLGGTDRSNYDKYLD